MIILTLATPPDPALASLALIRQGSESRGSRETGDLHGRSLAVGDFNGDSIEDLAVGSPFEDVSGVSHAGAVIVSFGTDLGLSHQGAQLLLQSDGDALETGAGFAGPWRPGTSTTTGTTTSRSALRAPTTMPRSRTSATCSSTPAARAASPTGTISAAGSRGLCRGKRPVRRLALQRELQRPRGHQRGPRRRFSGGGWGRRGDLLLHRRVERPAERFERLAQTIDLRRDQRGGDQFGYSLAAAMSGEAPTTILSRAPPSRRSTGSTTRASCGSCWGPTPVFPIHRRSDPSGRGRPPEPALSGWLLRLGGRGGRFFGGSFDGVAIGEPGRSYLGHPESGRVVVGKGSLFGLNFGGANAITLFQNDTGWALGDDDGFGRALASGFYDAADGYEDLAIGSPTDNANGGPFGAGVVSILFGGSNGPGAHGWTGWAEDAWRDDIEANDQFGTSVAIGRFDGTGKGNLAIGAPGEDANTGMVCISAPGGSGSIRGSRMAWPSIATGTGSTPCARSRRCASPARRRS